MNAGRNFLILLLAAPTTHVTLLDEVVRVPARDWRYAEVTLKQRPAWVSAEYEATGGSAEVRLALLRREDLDSRGQDFSRSALALTSPAPAGRLAYGAPLHGVYAVLVDNGAGTSGATVHLRVFLDFGTGSGPAVTSLSPARRFAVIAISFAVFFAIVIYSARRLLRVMRY
ncbi:MAG: hypothetical protein JO336_08495 [Acidobacteriia bacterium]|nr:hypothetical protein [Terriglobia bacterium]MBV8902976.1 hypothetical protein [Terriglobia bacterium]